MKVPQHALLNRKQNLGREQGEGSRVEAKTGRQERIQEAARAKAAQLEVISVCKSHKNN